MGEQSGERSFRVTLKNTMRRAVTWEATSVQVEDKNGKTTSADLAQKSAALVESSTCKNVRGRELRSGWTTTCTVTLSEEAMAKAASVKFVARAVSQMRHGYHLVAGVKDVRLDSK